MKKKNVILMNAIVLLQGMVFYASISSLYRLDKGLSLGEYALIDSISFIFTLAMEIPWGIIADKIGYKKALIIANGFFFISKIIFWKADSFLLFLLERFVMSIAVAGLSGVDISILYLSCEEEESQKVFSFYNAFGTVGMLMAAFSFSYFKMSYEQTAIWTMYSYLLAFILSLFLSEVKEGKMEIYPASYYGRIIKDTLKDHKVIYLILSAALINVASWSIVVLLNQSQYLRSGLPEEMIGYLVIGTTLMSLGGVWSDGLTRRLGDGRMGSLMMLAMTVSCFILSLTENIYVSFAMVAMVELTNSLLIPLFTRMKNERVVIADRATQLSIYSMFGDVMCVIPNYLVGETADMSLPKAFIFIGILLLISWGIFLMSLRKVSE